MKRFLAILFAATALISCSRQGETVKGDPLHTQIHTLDNGLKVYMTVNKNEPRLQTFIAVRTGGKTDPSDNTGLAHYLEHIMFKGTPSFGTSDYEAEKPLLDQIEECYNVYRTLTDKGEREAMYHKIDSLSYEASRYSIPNEYDKLMSVIGANGTNAYTSNDVTCYTEDIPSNRIEDWAKIQADRFKNMVVRGFHTELEAVYEEYNTGLTSDTGKALDKLDSLLYPNHPYGKQTVIGTQEHLKNPSISAIKKQKETYYVPNNTAICVSGDFDPDEFVKIIEKHFGDWKPNNDLKPLEYKPEEPITEPKGVEAWGMEDEFVMLSWRTPGSSDAASLPVNVTANVLSNGNAGLIDLDLVLPQKVLGVQVFPYTRTDYGQMVFYGSPKEGQTLEEVKGLILEEVAKLRNGDFDDDLVPAIISNLKLDEMRALESNRSRADMYVSSFVDGISWKESVRRNAATYKLTKEDIVNFAKEYLGENSYVYVIKRTGEDKSIHKIEAPKITPILTNRDKQSDFLLAVQAEEVKPIEPVFTDFSKDLEKLDYNGLELLYKKNDVNDIAHLAFLYDKGTNQDPALDLALNYVDYLNTPERSAEELSTELYKLACNQRGYASARNTTIIVSGLSENIGKALELVNDHYLNAEGDEDVLGELKGDILKSRADMKLSQDAVFRALRTYVMYGPEFVAKSNLTNAQVSATASADLLAKVKDIYGSQHKILYYGPASKEEVISMLDKHHPTEGLKPVVKENVQMQLTSTPGFYLVDYNSQQFNYIEFSNRGEKLDVAAAPQLALFNEYFGGGMNSIVFQEMRESKALAYYAGAYLRSPSFKDDSYCFYAMINSQNDKLKKAVTAFDDIINNMPEAEANFEIAKQAIESRLRTQRTTGFSVLNSYLSAEELGIDKEIDQYVFEGLQPLTMEDVKSVQQKWIKDRTYVYGIVGNTKDLDLAYLKSIAPVKVLSVDEVFGF